MRPSTRERGRERMRPFPLLRFCVSILRLSVDRRIKHTSASQQPTLRRPDRTARPYTRASTQHRRVSGLGPDRLLRPSLHPRTPHHGQRQQSKRACDRGTDRPTDARAKERRCSKNRHPRVVLLNPNLIPHEPSLRSPSITTSRASPISARLEVNGHRPNDALPFSALLRLLL